MLNEKINFYLCLRSRARLEEFYLIAKLKEIGQNANFFGLFAKRNVCMDTENKTSGRRKFLNGDGGKRLMFIAEFMNRTGNTTTTIAQQMGYKSRQTVFYWLDKDDMKMSKCYELFDACGYKITFSMIAKSEVKIDCTADVVMMTEDKSKPGDKRLSFLARAISKSGMTQEAVAKAVGLRRTAIQHWLNEVDDCLVSQVYETADVIGMKVKINIEPK